MNELSKNDSKAIQGIAVMFMIALHLFCRREALPYETLININNVPLIYYFGLWGDQCVALFLCGICKLSTAREISNERIHKVFC